MVTKNFLGIDFHHATLANVAIISTIVLLALVILYLKFGNIRNGAGGGKSGASAKDVNSTDELDLRISVARGYIRATINYIQALENTTVSLLELKSNNWRNDEREEMKMSHELLAERTESATSMFKSEGGSTSSSSGSGKNNKKRQ